MDYFSEIVSKFRPGELQILNVLYNAEAINGYSSVPNEFIKKESNLSDANYRKHISNLQRLLFVEEFTGNKTRTFCISSYGLAAIEKITSEKVGLE